MTQPLNYLGITAEMLDGDQEAAIRFNEPAAGMMSGLLQKGTDVAGGRSYANQRKITVNTTSLSIVMSDAELQDLGVDCDHNAGIPPIVEVWAGEGGLILKTVEDREISVETVDHELAKLPEKMREDFIAVEVEGRDPTEVANDRGLSTFTASPEGTDKEYEYSAAGNVKKNVEKAKQLLANPEAAIEAKQEQTAEQEALTFTPVERVQINDSGEGYNAYSVALTKTMRAALPDDATGAEATEISLHYQPNAATEGVVPTSVDIGEQAQSTGRGRPRIRKVNVKNGDLNSDAVTPDDLAYSVKLPDLVIEELGFGDGDDPTGEVLSTLAADDSIVFERPPTREFRIEEPELQKAKRAEKLEGHSGNNWYLNEAKDEFAAAVADLHEDASWASTLREADVDTVEGRRTIETAVTEGLPDDADTDAVEEAFAELREKFDDARYVEWDEDQTVDDIDSLWLDATYVTAALARRLHNEGFDTPEDVLEADTDDLLAITGMGAKTADAIVEHAEKLDQLADEAEGEA
jgi:hypothetical protein